MRTEFEHQYVCHGGPQAAIILYNTEHGNNTMIATLNPIKKGVIGNGQLIDLRALREYLGRVSEKNPRPDKGEWMDQIIYRGWRTTVWDCPSRVCPIRWNVHSCPESETLNSLDGTVIRHPNLIFINQDGTNQVFAYVKKENRWKDTLLYVPPYLNVGAKGNICMPMNFRPGKKLVENVEKAFFDSAFSHLAFGGKKQIDHKGGLDKFWVDYCCQCKEKVPTSFPWRKLVPYKKLEEVL